MYIVTSEVMKYTTEEEERGTGFLYAQFNLLIQFISLWTNKKTAICDDCF
ncbi:hypothetical protein J42TS3_45490 [Paenibacillus vini]|uniref:Uncharacterized protein n=1 Tax=Paenibacillus vini TaxID=1476024 RepID=A0ABQ4MHQ0_9BACL|nr:hypothetical protein J42TS3_45490 [Paenibacillus vini]